MSRFSLLLKTPRPNTPNLLENQRSYLVESPEALAILGEFNSSPRSYDDRVSAAYALAGLVRRSLWFKADSAHRPLFSPENLANDQTTDCYGYTVVLSELLSVADIDHSIVFANKHAFVVLVDAETDTTSMVDTPTRQFYCDITGAFELTPSDRVKATRLDTSVVIKESGFSDKSTIEAWNPWLSFAPHNSDSRTISERRSELSNQLAARLFPPTEGRQTIEAYSRFSHYVLTDSYLSAYNEISELNGTYPDIDKRNQLKLPRKLIVGLASTSFILEALDVIDIIRLSTQHLSEDSFFKIWPIDMLYKVATIAGSPDLQQKSIHQYEELLESSSNAHLKRLVASKILRRQVV